MPRGQLRIYLGAGPGVGKTYAMLEEGQRRSRRGTDVVVGAVDPHDRPRTAALLQTLEIVGPSNGSVSLDLTAVLARRPTVVLVDDLARVDHPTHDIHDPAHPDVPRWAAVDRLREAGIHVLGTVDISELESLVDVAGEVSGLPHGAVVPDRFVRSADEIQFVDQTPEALRSRLAHGNIFPATEVDPGLADAFRSEGLAALRLMALTWMADWVAEGIESDQAAETAEPAGGRATPGRRWETREAVVVAMTGAPSGEHVIRRAARLADRQRARLVGVHIRSVDAMTASSGLDAQRRLLTDLGGEYREVASGDVAAALVEVSVDENASQLVLGTTRRSRWMSLTRGSLITEVLELAPLDVHVIGPPPDERPPPDNPASVRQSVFAPRRLALAWVAAFALPATVVAVMSWNHPAIGLSAKLLLMVLAVALVAVLGGARPALASAVFAFLLSNWYFIPPYHELTISSSEDAVSITVFLLVAIAVGTYVSASARRAAAALAARSDASTLAALAGTVATSSDPLPAILERLREVFGAEGAALFDRSDGPPKLVAASGPEAPANRDSAERRFPVGLTGELLLAGGPVRVVDRSATTAFLDQLAVALEQRRLRAGEQEAAKVATANELRATLLAAVSHDLRTPLTAVKTAVSGLRQPDVEWPPEVRDELLETIEDGADRLTTLITNLLDLTRIQSGAVELRMGPVRLDEVAHGAAIGIGHSSSIQIDVDDDLPGVMADGALLEHVVANLLDNAVKYSPDGETVHVDASPVGDAVHLRVVDRGRGIPAEERAEMLRPFRRREGSTEDGAGLGLAVAHGFAQLMGVDLVIGDTPGGGTTVTLMFVPAPPAASPNTASPNHVPAASPTSPSVEGDDDEV